jgi:hypothetical protein
MRAMMEMFGCLENFSRRYYRFKMHTISQVLNQALIMVLATLSSLVYPTARRGGLTAARPGARHPNSMPHRMCNHV